MKSFTNIMKQCKNVEKANDKIRKLCGDIREEISSSMDEIWEELKRVQGEE